MKELRKTLIYCICALVAIAAGALARPRIVTVDAEIESKIGKPLFEGFDEPAKATSLEIVEFDEAVAEKSTFKVARDRRSKAWTIPSHHKYPADAGEQMRDAALALIDLNVIDVASRVASDHELYGVISPDTDLKASTQGVGKMAIVKDAKDVALAEIIIGKSVKGSDGQRFVRRRGEEPVYVVRIDPTKLPTEFDRWIEKDLLKLTAFDVETLSLRDYSVIPRGNQFLIDQRLQIDARFETTGGKWELDKMFTFDRRGGTIPAQLLDEEELNTTQLNDVKTALDELEIVDVVRKPEGLGDDLRASKEFMEDRANREDLMKRGFYVLPIGANQENMLTSANGEIHVTTRDGIRYILRFGSTTGTQDKEGQLNRFLFVTAEIDHSKIPKPILAPLPIGAEPTEDGKDAGKETEAKEPGKDDPAKAENETKAPEGTITEGDAPKISNPDELVAERERVTQENSRKMDEYNEKLKNAETEVRTLQNRFGDWYYIISNDVYKKIHLGRADIIQERTGDAVESFGVDALRTLQEQGLKGGK